MKKLETLICVTFQRPGYHNYPAAPDEVSYLRHPHRHLFKFVVKLEVFSDDREVEFHMFLNWLEASVGSTALTLDAKACERIADELAELISTRFTGRKLYVEVWEDGECGSSSTYQL